MAKPDWGELQRRFLSDHAATGVSPKDWCEAQGLNYATARRYIKKPTAQTAQKPAQKKLRTAQKEKCAEELVDSKLSPKVKRFIAEYLKDHNATAAAERAGYSDPNYGRQLLTNPNVAQAIAQQQKASIVRTLGSADEVLEQMWRPPPSMLTSFLSIAAGAAVTAGASVTSINGAMRLSSKRSWLRL